MFDVRSRRKRRIIYSFIIAIIVLFAISSYSFYVYIQTKKITDTKGYIQMKIEKVVTAGQLSAVQLKAGCYELSYQISPEQALAIFEGMSNSVKPRPMTHDVFVDVLEGFEIKPIMVKITKISDNIYFAELIMEKWNRLLIVDIRPSDAMALAVRMDTPIYVNEKLATKMC